MVPLSSNLRDQFATFIAALFEPDDIVEVRAIDCRDLPKGVSKLIPRQWWRAANDLPGLYDTLVEANAAGFAIYIGANPRTEMGGGKSEHVSLARALFVDFDGGVMPDAALVRVAGAGLPTPSMIIASGHGTHVYWKLAAPMTDMGVWTRTQKALIGLLGTDDVIHDPPRIMRAPGFLNNKREPHVLATLVSVDDTKYGVDQFPTPGSAQPSRAFTSPARSLAACMARLDVEDSRPGKHNLSRKTLLFLQIGVLEGERNKALFRAACDFAGNGLSEEQAQQELGAAAERCGLLAPEAAATIKSAFGQIRAPSRKTKPKNAMPLKVAEAKTTDAAATEAASEGDGPDKPNDDEDSETGDDGQAPQSELLARLAHEQFIFGRTELDEAFAVPRDGPRFALMFSGNKRKINNTLAKVYRKQYGRIPNAAARADALAAIEGETQDMEPQPVYMRLAPYQNGVLLDLARVDGQVVYIHDGVWDLLAVSPVLFRRSVLTGEMVLPVRGAGIEEFRELLNITDRDWPLFMGWLVACMIPGIPHPVLMLGGEQGTGKSTAARFAVQVVDPSPAPLRCPPKDLSDWIVAASQSWVVVLDNLSSIPEWLADAICRAATGDGLVKRALFTDSDLAVLNFRRVVVITSIDAGALRGDLGDRLILIDLMLIPEEMRRDDAAMEKVFQEAKPRLLGAVLDLAAKVLAQMPLVELKVRPRMADFARVLGGLDRVKGTSSVGAFMDQRSRIAGTVVESSPVADAVQKLIAEVESWEGTAGQLLACLSPDKLPHKWPRNATAMAGELRRVSPALRLVGIEVVVPALGDKTRTYHIYTRPTLTLEGRETTARNAQPPKSGPGASLKGDSAWADARAVEDDRPRHRPIGSPSQHPENGHSGRSGGSGGQIPHLQHEPAPGPPDRCFACDHRRWWSKSGLLHWTCGGCHAPALDNGPVIYWHGNEVVP